MLATAPVEQTQFLLEIGAIEVLPPRLLLGEDAPGIPAVVTVGANWGQHLHGSFHVRFTMFHIFVYFSNFGNRKIS